MQWLLLHKNQCSDATSFQIPRLFKKNIFSEYGLKRNRFHQTKLNLSSFTCKKVNLDASQCISAFLNWSHSPEQVYYKQCLKLSKTAWKLNSQKKKFSFPNHYSITAEKAFKSRKMQRGIHKNEVKACMVR